MRCEYCGSDIDDNAGVCPFCDAVLTEGDGKAPAQEAPAPAEDAPAPAEAPAVEASAPVEDVPGAPAPAEDAPAPAPAPAPEPVPAAAPAAAAAARPDAPAPQKRKSRLPIIIAAAVVVVAIVVGAFAFGGGSGSGASVPKEAKEAIQDASALADELANRYEGFKASATDNAQESASGEARTADVASGEIEEGLTRIAADKEALKAAGSSWQGFERALAAMDNLEATMAYERDVFEAQSGSIVDGASGMTAAMQTISNLYDNYSAIDVPAFIGPYMEKTLEQLPTIYSALVYSNQSSSILSQYTSSELISWWMTKQSASDAYMNDILIRQCEASQEMLDNLLAGKTTQSAPKVEIDAIAEIAPNLYPSLDAAVNLGVTAYDGSHSIMVTAEVVGFTQTFEQKYDLPQGYCYLPIKPALLTSIDTSKLANNSTTQLDVKVTDAETGEVLAQQSQPVELLSMYDFTWDNDEFGATAAFDILAWLRPQADEVNAINRSAASILGSWTGGAYTSIAGYQYGTDATSTLIQCAAIQAAISKAGVVYVMDSYSFTSDQHVLTPDAVVQKQQGLCIETSLLMASCLMSANMHPLIIITPGHAQVAVETYSGSGNYFLLETTTLPYSGVDTSYTYTQGGFYNGLLASAKTTSGGVYYWTTSGSSDEWQTYFENRANGSDQFGGIFVIDCSLQRIMGIQGLENI